MIKSYEYPNPYFKNGKVHCLNLAFYPKKSN